MITASANVSRGFRALAQSLLDRLGAAFDTAVARAAVLCARDGKLDYVRLDQHQWICYELALADADLLAGKALVSVGADASEVDGALGSLLRRMQSCRCWQDWRESTIAIDVDAQPLLNWPPGDDLRRLRRDASGPEVSGEARSAVRTRTARSRRCGRRADCHGRERSAVSRRRSSRQWRRRFIATTDGPRIAACSRCARWCVRPVRFRRNTRELAPRDTRTRR